MAEIARKTEKLNNGLTLIGECNRQGKSAAIGFFVKTGSRDEQKAESGVSHFLEHMMFKGTAKRSALDISFELGNIGAQANAYTSEENTVYYGGILPEYFPQMQELLSDMIRPSLDSGEFDTEKKVILEEIALYQDRPQFYLFEHAMEEYFNGHVAGNSVLGTTESISALTRDQMLDYFTRRYSPSNICLVGSGNFDWDRFVSDANKYCGDWKNFVANREVKSFNRPPITKTYTRANINRSHVLLVASGPGAQDSERYPIGVLSCILGDSTGSRLYWELIDKGLADAASIENDEKDGVGCLCAYASTDPDKLDSVASVLRRVIGEARKFTDEELSRAKTKTVSRVALSGELPMGRLMALGLDWNYRETLNDLKETIFKINSVSRKEINAALDRFSLKELSEFRLVPERS